MDFKPHDPMNDGISMIQLIDFMGGDLSVVNDAKASFSKESTEMSEKEIKLLHYLWEHDHSSPFRSTVFKFKVKAPLGIARQWWKHVLASNHNDEQIGWNEQSLRYVTIDKPEFYVPIEFRKQSKSNKQCSEGVLDAAHQKEVSMRYLQQCLKAFDTYQYMIDVGVAREQARFILPPAIYTSWVWTVSLQALLNFIELRLIKKGAQGEISAYADYILKDINELVPYSISALLGTDFRKAD